jgi:hypothetical protein
MSCEPATVPEWTDPPPAPFARGIRGWLAFAAIGGMLVVFAITLWRIANPNVDEAYRRTFITREFAIYPTSPVYGGRNGLTYELGRRVQLAEGNNRWYLARYEFYRFDKVTPFLKGFRGRLYFHLPPMTRQPEKPHRLAMQITCRFDDKPATEMAVSVNGTPIGVVPCANGSATFEATLPPGLIGARDYDMIEIRRTPRDLSDRFETRFATAYGRVAWDWFEVDVVRE